MQRTLAELIREGARLRPQGFKWFASDDGRTCALGAAYHALCGVPEGDAPHMSVTRCRGLETALTDFWVRCPECASCPYTLGDILGAHLNDSHRWTREEIADWLDTLFIQPYADVPEHRPWLTQTEASRPAATE